MATVTSILNPAADPSLSVIAYQKLVNASYYLLSQCGKAEGSQGSLDGRDLLTNMFFGLLKDFHSIPAIEFIHDQALQKYL